LSRAKFRGFQLSPTRSVPSYPAHLASIGYILLDLYITFPLYIYILYLQRKHNGGNSLPNFEGHRSPGLSTALCLSPNNLHSSHIHLTDVSLLSVRVHSSPIVPTPSKDLAESSPNEGNAQANSKEVTVNNSQYSRRCSSHFTIPPCCLNLLHPPCLLVKSLVYCISSATLRSVFSSEVYDLRLGSGFRPTGGRDLGGGRVCIPGIGKGGRIIVKAGLGERHLRIG
jgi:hypothetical protein